MKTHKSILSLQNISDGAFINPPYCSPMIDKIIAFLIKIAYKDRRVFAIIVPHWTTTLWFKTLRALGTPCFLLSSTLCFLRGKDRQFAGRAKFKSCIFLVGAFTEEPLFHIDTDALGFPMSLNYIEYFNKISFPRSIGASHGTINHRCFTSRAAIILKFLANAEKYIGNLQEADITNSLDLNEVKIYNFFSQKVSNSIDFLDSHQWRTSLNPWIESRTSWTKFSRKSRVMHSYKTGMKFISDLLDPPADEQKDHICTICQSRGHYEHFCFFAIPTSAQLGLASIGDKLLYQFICTQAEHTNTISRNHLSNPRVFISTAKKWLSLEAKFWSRWKSFAKKHNVTNPQHIIFENEFSKGRSALGFNWATGAQKNELLLDAFGACLKFHKPPPPCEFVNEIHNGTPVYDNIPESLQKEDEEEIRKRTQYIIPRDYIRFILPRFIVTNTDLTQRSINDCQWLGPYTPIYRYKLPSPKSLRNFSQNDIILSVDGKSAYKQRKLAWSARNQIGFRTKINGACCYVAMATPPFGMHNAGFIYQKSLEIKLDRAAANLIWLEYIDDISIRIGSKNDDLSKSSWIAAAFIWTLTKSGEILNDKFYVFKDIITMLGVSYNLSTDRFIPKINSYYKLALHTLRMLRKPRVSIKDLEIFTGKTQWMVQSSNNNFLTPIYKYIGRIKAQLKPQTSRDHKKIQCISIDWNLGLLNCIFDTFWKINNKFMVFNEPNISIMKDICFIVCDANPHIAGAYLAIGPATIEFETFCPQHEESFPIPSIPKSYIQKYNLESFFHSTRSEAMGLYMYLQKKLPKLQEISNRIDSFIVLGDNLALISNLQSGKTSSDSASFIHTKILNTLKSLGKPYTFRWLRRSRSPIVHADSLGRIIHFAPNNHAIATIQKFFQIKIFIPKIFQDPWSIPLRFPNHVIDPIRNSSKVPAIFLPLAIDPDTFRLIMQALAFIKTRIIIGTPYFNRTLIKQHLLMEKSLLFPKITTEFFIGDSVSTTPKRNFHFVVAFFNLSNKSTNGFL